MSRQKTTRKSNSTVRGRNLTKITLSPEEMARLYGAPTTGKAKVEAEMASLNADRTASPESDWVEEWDRETTPNRAELVVNQSCLRGS